MHQKKKESISITLCSTTIHKLQKKNHVILGVGNANQSMTQTVWIIKGKNKYTSQHTHTHTR